MKKMAKNPIKIKFNFVGEPISIITIKKAWDKLTNRKFPKVRAFILSENEYVKMIRKMMKDKIMKKVGIEGQLREYGNYRNPEETCASLVCADENDWVIIMKEETDIDENLEHELAHILEVNKQNEFTYNSKKIH